MTVSRAQYLLFLLCLALMASLAPLPLASAADDFDSLRAEIAAANRAGSGAIQLSADVLLAAPLPPITGELAITGDGHTISGAGEQRIFDVDGGQLTLIDLTLTEGKAPEDEDGGALRARNGARVSARRVTFSDSRAFQGGAIAANGDVTLDLRNSSLIGNSAEAYGGAIFSYGSQVDIKSSSFQRNRAQYDGGALAAHEETRMSISNSTFAGNSANAGGALEVFASVATLTHVTMMNNSAKPAGAGAIHRTAGEIRLYNSIVGGAQPGGQACLNGLTEARGNLSQDGTCSLMETRTDPLLGELTGAPARFPLLDGSPALDAADPEHCLESDQVGTPRPHGGGCDIGAIESATARLAPTPIVPPPACPLADQIIAANTDAPSGGCPAGSGADTISLTGDVTLREALPTVTSEITIEGNGYTISGSGRSRVFDIERGNLALKNMTIQHGRATYGGAIRVRGSGRVAVEGVTFFRNSADVGGAIATQSANASATVNRSIFVGNRSRNDGGAIAATRGRVAISKSSFEKNVAGSFGGALHTEYGGLTVGNSTFNDNSAIGGGVLNALSGRATLTHVTMLNNIATQSNGNAIKNLSSAIYLRNSIVGGGGDAHDCSGGLTQMVGNLSEDGTCITSGRFGEPMLGELTGSPAWRAPLDGSPALDAADPSYCPPTDQLGTPRPQGGACDIGAIESTTARPAQPDTMLPVCGLYDQILAANTDRPSGACPAGSGADTITLSEDIVLGRPLPTITSGLRIEGNGHAISGDGRFRIFTVKGTWLQLVDLTLTAGSNPRGNGGAIEMLADASVAVRNSRFVDNRAKYGGAITMFGRNSKLTVMDSSFERNTAIDSHGGAIDMRAGQLTITGSSFVENQASTGGAIATGGGGEVRIANSTFSGNSASSWGGAISAGYPPITLTHVTMLDNRGGLYHQYGAGHALWIHRNNSGFYIRNSIIASDMPDEVCVGRITQSIGILAADSACRAKLAGDPLLGDLTGDPAWHAPLPGSPAIDAADARFCTAADQKGSPRPQGGGCDIGAIETVPVPRDVSDCAVTTTHALNFRAGPGGEKLGTVPAGATLGASARTAGWFRVAYGGRTGWISADYVIAEGVCG
ncbi:MAG: SH3 domain-containing protein [Chloroflexi bacterium]|nr:SH3 domain-containing protein [Chloroflexota bacterium]